MLNNKLHKLTVSGLAAMLLLASLLAPPNVSSASVRPTFTDASLKGPYSILLEKWLSDQNSKPETLVGVFNFDGNGNVSISSFTDNNGGTVTTGTGTGTYSMKSKGTGSIKASLSNGDSGTFSIVLDANGKGFQLILTRCANGCGSGVLSGTAVASGGSSFSNASLKGKYEFLTVRWPSGQNPDSNNVIGILNFDGAGAVTASATQDDAGNVQTITASGTYSVSPDGSGTMTLTDKQGSIAFAFAINSAGKGSQIIGTTNDEVQSGTTTRQ